MSSLGSGESRRRAEIELKRARLAELKRAREERTGRLLSDARNPKDPTDPPATTATTRPDSRASASTATGGGAASSGASPRPSSSTRRDLDDLVASLVSSRRTSSGRSPTHPDPRDQTPASAGTEVDSTTSHAAPTTTDSAPPSSASASTFVTQVTQLFEVPPREKLYYTKQVQTASVGDSDEDDDHHFDTAEGGGSGAGVGTEVRGVRVGSDGTVSGLSPDEEKRVRHHVLAQLGGADLSPAELDAILTVAKEQERLRAQEQALEREIEQDIKVLTHDQVARSGKSNDLASFLEQSTRIVERALTDSYDVLADYRVDDAAGRRMHQGGEASIELSRTFWDEQLLKHRSVTSIDWSTLHPELCVAAYSKSLTPAGAIGSGGGSSSLLDDSNAPDGLACVWNTHLLSRPEFVFHAPVDVLSVTLSPFHPNLVVGGTYSGQIVVWDTRARALPVLKSPLSANNGHTHPVYNVTLVGTRNAHHITSADTDGSVCTWMLDQLSNPLQRIELTTPPNHRVDASAGAISAHWTEANVTALAFAAQETNTFLVGCEDGALYSAQRFDRAGTRAGISASERFLPPHAAPVTGLSYHPASGQVDLSDLVLSSSMDWTSRLWRASTGAAAAAAAAASAATTTDTKKPDRRTGRVSEGGGNSTLHTPLLSFDESNDYVYDVQWHPTHPAVFAQVDGAGNLDLYNLNHDSERPVVRTSVGNGHALNKVRFSPSGHQVATGGADGRVYVYDISDHLAIPTEQDWVTMQENVTRWTSASQATYAPQVAQGYGRWSAPQPGYGLEYNGKSRLR